MKSYTTTGALISRPGRPIVGALAMNGPGILEICAERVVLRPRIPFWSWATLLWPIVGKLMMRSWSFNIDEIECVERIGSWTFNFRWHGQNPRETARFQTVRHAGAVEAALRELGITVIPISRTDHVSRLEINPRRWLRNGTSSRRRR